MISESKAVRALFERTAQSAELDAATGMYYYGARYYDPRLSIFISVDPLAEKTMEPYLYTGNNPIMFTDPTGMEKIIPSKIFMDKPYGAIHQGLMEGSKTYKSLLSKYENSDKFNYNLYVNDKRLKPGNLASSDITPGYKGNKLVEIKAQTFYRDVNGNEMSEIAIAKTLIHEAVHMKIASEGNMSKDDSNHNYFAKNYIGLIKDGLVEYNNHKKLGYSESQLEALSWEGNHNSDSFKTYINNKVKLNNSDYDTEYNKWTQEVNEIRYTKKES